MVLGLDRHPRLRHLSGQRHARSGSKPAGWSEAAEPDTLPTFLMHTYADTVVPVENSLLFAQACAAHKVPFALQVYEKGAHGVGLGSASAPETFEWPKACAEWFKARGMV
jgi:alpha-beta hydrolase superfamily lysophospholipase